jgi:hypothetical protein
MKVLRVSVSLVVACVTLSVCSLLSSGFTAYAASPSAVPDNPRISSPPAVDVIRIPGPLRSFQRMAGISQEVQPPEVLPRLARKVYMFGYQQGSPTEFLLLIDRYLQQARELQVLAGSSGTIRVAGCDDAATLIRILGYRLRQGCGEKTFSLETANPTRAFLTIDSGFPLVELEEALQNGTPFVYPYPSTPVPVLFHESDWGSLRTVQRRDAGDLLTVLLSDPTVARLYWAMSQEDTETRNTLQRSPGLQALVPYASVLEFYGSQISIHSGHVLVPGGAPAQAAWKDLVGANPDSPGKFILALIQRDKGWLAAYFDTLSRVSQAQQKHLTESSRLKRLYEASRLVEPTSSATEGVFRKNPDLLVLFTRIQWEPSGAPHIPGGVDVWKEILREKGGMKSARDMGKRAQGWSKPEQLLEGMAALSQLETDSGPLQVFLTAVEIDRQRPEGSGVSAPTLRLLASKYAQFSTWYQVFTEFPDLNDASIERFVNIAANVDKIQNRVLRANTEGSYQAAIGLWQILARQGQIPSTQLNVSWMKLVEPFAAITTPAQLFDASRGSLGELLAAAGGNSNSTQAEIVDLLAGPKQGTPDGKRVHQALAARIGSVLEDQRLVSLDTLFALSDGLKDMAQGKGKGDGLLPLAAELREFDLPQPIFTHSEKISWAPPIYTDHHAELQVRTDLTKVITGPSTHEQLDKARGQLSPFLRDTLVGLNYAYYEPPQAQMLHHNPLFVRSHDFLGISVLGSNPLWGAPRVLGVGTPAGGGAYLMGSLSDLSYALATTEEDFIAPRNIQALILKELAPVLIVSATIPRWWNVTPNELHAVTLYQRSGEELLAASSSNPQLRDKVMDILSDRMGPQRIEEVERSLQGDKAASMIAEMTPSETSYLAAEFHNRYASETQTWGPASQQLDELRSHDAADVNWDRISRDFGVPHPTLAQTNARELLSVKPFPFFGAYSSRLFGESWESTNLYWARLADELGYSPVALNNLVPELTRHMIENTFATDLDDWPAVLRAMQKTGDEFRKGKIAALPAAHPTTGGSIQTASSESAQ